MPDRQPIVEPRSTVHRQPSTAAGCRPAGRRRAGRARCRPRPWSADGQGRRPPGRSRGHLPDDEGDRGDDEGGGQDGGERAEHPLPVRRERPQAVQERVPADVAATLELVGQFGDQVGDEDVDGSARVGDPVDVINGPGPGGGARRGCPGPAVRTRGSVGSSRRRSVARSRGPERRCAAIKAARGPQWRLRREFRGLGGSQVRRRCGWRGSSRASRPVGPVRRPGSHVPSPYGPFQPRGFGPGSSVSRPSAR